ncbi:MAG: lysophospholipid acyltransferase [Geoglossum umbratile]|nr:MAG: lysophospholipid acyltransferase [Geoglossum umbratile]
MLPYIDYPFFYAAHLLGASTDELKLTASFLLSYPLAAVLKRIPDSRPAQKNLFIIAVSLFYLVGLFDLWGGIRTLFISSAGAYAIAACIPGPFMPWIGFVFLMGHMSVNHLHRQFVNAPDRVDITGAQMVLVMKLSGFCWNVHDGRLPAKDLSEHQLERALRQLPGALDFAAYVLFFPSLFAGPAFDYVDYRRWIETSMFELPPGADPSLRAPTRKKRKIPRSGTPAAWKAASGLFWIFLFLKFSGWYSTELLLSDKFMSYGFLRRVWILHMFGFTARLKYYGVWSLSEGSCILSGMGYKGVDPKTGKVMWNRLQNVNPWSIETAQNTRGYLEGWNINTNHWLRNYMYLRVTPRGKKPGFRASMATFVTSAFWHGFYPGYYLTFILASFLQTVAKKFRRHVRPFFLSPDGKTPTKYKIHYDICGYVATQLSFAFVAAPFIVLSFRDSLLVWSRVYFFCIIGVAVSMAFFASPAKPLLIKKLAKRNTPALKRPDSQEHLPSLGLPSDPEKELDEVIAEVKEEIESRRRKSLQKSQKTPTK